jgi:hypothetical protein
MRCADPGPVTMRHVLKIMSSWSTQVGSHVTFPFPWSLCQSGGQPVHISKPDSTFTPPTRGLVSCSILGRIDARRTTQGSYHYYSSGTCLLVAAHSVVTVLNHTTSTELE